MSNEIDPMKEIHDIREKIWLEDKGLSIAEKIKKTREIASRMLSEMGMRDRIVSKKETLK